jgi:hypothetical protein
MLLPHACQQRHRIRYSEVSYIKKSEAEDTSDPSYTQGSATDFARGLVARPSSEEACIPLQPISRPPPTDILTLLHMLFSLMGSPTMSDGGLDPREVWRGSRSLFVCVNDYPHTCANTLKSCRILAVIHEYNDARL